jgi:hypothetical protein
MTRIEAETLKAQVGLTLIQLTLCLTSAHITGDYATSKVEGAAIGNELRQFIDSMVVE